MRLGTGIGGGWQGGRPALFVWLLLFRKPRSVDCLLEGRKLRDPESARVGKCEPLDRRETRGVCACVCVCVRARQRARAVGLVV